MKIVVTGCNGRVGRHVVAFAIKNGHKIHGVDSAVAKEEPDFFRHSGFSFSEADLRDYDQALRVLQDAEAVIHLAGIPEPMDFLVDTHNTNVVISWNVLRAAAELGITRVAQASSVNVVRLVWSVMPKLHYLPLDEEHPREPDEPYGLSKLICEIQADSIVARHPFMRVASLRPSWVIPTREYATEGDPSTERRKNDLWGWAQEESTAEAFVLAVTTNSGSWLGHEAFFIVAPSVTADEEAEHLRERYWRDVPIKAGKNLKKGFFDCSKAERLLGWVHR
ncbi:NAD(P)-binding protein [Cytidiella melzeri]|nr:NAD(P)-binding protein [Cytidiella melzeri]